MKTVELSGKRKVYLKDTLVSWKQTVRIRISEA
jgi:hypothetical protein